MTPQRFREIAVLLLTDAKHRRATAVRARIEYSEYSQEAREKAAQELETEAQHMEKAARELQEFSFTWKG